MLVHVQLQGEDTAVIVRRSGRAEVKADAVITERGSQAEYATRLRTRLDGPSTDSGMPFAPLSTSLLPSSPPPQSSPSVTFLARVSYHHAAAASQSAQIWHTDLQSKRYVFPKAKANLREEHDIVALPRDRFASDLVLEDDIRHQTDRRREGTSSRRQLRSALCTPRDPSAGTHRWDLPPCI